MTLPTSGNCNRRIARTLAAALAVAAAATSLPALAQKAAPAAVPVATAGSSAVTEFTLANGVRIVLIPDHRVPVVTHMVWYAVGAADEAADQHGVAHYLEHMMFKGTAAYPKGEFDRFVMRRGGSHNATTSMNNTNYFQKLPKSALPQIMAMEADRMTHLKIEDGDVASERAVVLEEYRRGEVSISVALDKQMRAWLYGPASPRARTTIGTEEEIRALSGATAQHFYEQFYGPQRAMVIIAGDVTEAEARQLAENTYGKVAPRPNLSPRVTSTLPKAGESQRFEGSHERATAVRVNRSYLAEGMQSMSRRDGNAANLFAYIAGGGLTSRMHRRMINESGLATSTGCSFGFGRSTSSFDCYAWGSVGVPADTLEKAFNAVLDELAQGGVTDEEFAEIKSRFLTTAVYRKDNVSDRADTYGSSLAEGQSIADVEALEADVESLTKADVERVGQTLLRTARNASGVLTPKAPTATATQTTPAN